ncbi:MAG: hypothetical protein ICV78_17620 [Tolypothrix sp. Co-bin9]|nr:hypothetical protein [Tolypothrix sp. Co-bin9]
MLKLEVTSVTISDRLKEFLIIMRSRGWKNKLNIDANPAATLNLTSPQNL